MGTVRTHLSAREITISRGLLAPAYINLPSVFGKRKNTGMILIREIRRWQTIASGCNSRSGEGRLRSRLKIWVVCIEDYGLSVAHELPVDLHNPWKTEALCPSSPRRPAVRAQAVLKRDINENGAINRFRNPQIIIENRHHDLFSHSLFNGTKHKFRLKFIMKLPYRIVEGI